MDIPGSDTQYDLTVDRLNAPFSRFPAEIYGLIIAHLDDDKSTLSQCSLVNRAWLQFSRNYLFRTLIVKSAARLGSFMAFALLVEDAMHIGESIQTLTLQSLSHSQLVTGHWLAGDIRQHWPIIHANFLRNLMSKLPRLKRLYLTHVTFTSSPPDDMMPIDAQSRPRLEVLHFSSLGYVPSSEVRDIMAVLTVFSEVDELHFRHPKTRELRPRVGNIPASLPPGPLVRSLNFSAINTSAVECSRGVYAMLQRAGHLHSAGALTSLSWAGDSWELHEELSRYLKAAAPRLHTLRLNLGSWVFDSGEGDDLVSSYTRWDGLIVFSDLIMLESLTLTYDEPLDEGGYYPAFSTYTHLLLRPPPRLRHLTLRFPLDAPSASLFLSQLSGQESEWAELDRALDCITSLEVANVVCVASGVEDWSDAVPTSVGEIMPRMRSKGKLTVSWENTSYSFQ